MQTYVDTLALALSTPYLSPGILFFASRYRP